MKRPIWVLGCLYVLILVAAAFKLGGMCLSLEVKAVDLASLFVSIFIAVFLQFYLATRINDRRYEKNILIDAVRDAILAAHACRDGFYSCVDKGRITKEARSLVLAKLRGLANGLDLFEKTIDQSEFAKVKGDYEVVKGHLFEYKKALTGGNFPSKPYSSFAIHDEDRAFRQLYSELQGLMFRINRQS